MKIAALLLGILTSTSAFAHEFTNLVPLSETQIVDILSNSKMTGCLRQLQSLEKNYAYFIHEKPLHSAYVDKDKDVFFYYDLVQGGDMVMGQVKFRVLVDVDGQPGSEGFRIWRVKSCKFEKTLH